MTLRKCIFDNENYSERGSRELGATTEIIYKPWNQNFWGFLHFNQNERTDYDVPLQETVFQRVITNLAEFSIGDTHSLAIVINRLL